MPQRYVLIGPRHSARGRGYRTLTLIACLLTSPAAFGQLHWEKTQIEIDAALGQTNIAAHFRFQNVGTRPVTLFGLKDGCGCSTSNLAQRSYRSNEKGEFMLGFVADGRPGQFIKHATLQTDDPYQPNVYLALIARIPEALTIRPATLQWRVGEPAADKAAAIVLADAPGIAIESIECADPDLFSVRCEGAGRVRQLSIKPSRTHQPARAAIRIDVRFAHGIRQTYNAYAVIQP